MYPTCPRLASILIGCVALAPTAASSVLVVAPNGAPYATVQAAVDAAVNGDTILVRFGAYAGFVVDGKGLSIVGDTFQPIPVVSVEFRNLAAGQRALLSGFRVHEGVRASACAGALRFEGVEAEVAGPMAPYRSVDLESCLDVAFLRSTISGHGATTHSQGAGMGLYASHSRVVLYDCEVRGAPGVNGVWTSPTNFAPPGVGARACELVDSTLFAADSSIHGGAGGIGVPGSCFPNPTNGGPGANGGDGIVVDATSPTWAFATDVLPGAGGSGGVPAGCGTSAGPSGVPGQSVVGGTVNVLPGTGRSLNVPRRTREFVPIQLVFRGEPGDAVWLQSGTQTNWALDVPRSGVRLVGPGARRTFLGVVPANGELAVTLTIPDLGAGVESWTVQLQAVAQSVSGTWYLGSAQVLVVLDTAF